MDLVRELKEVRFELNLRGYDCEAVDAFLAKLRSDIAAVQQENDSASERIASLEAQVQDGGGSSETEGTLRRTLVLAQRLADETEAESKQAAAELIDGATAEANDLRASAEAEAADMRSNAESEAASMRQAAEDELAAARDEAASIQEETNKEAAKSRAESRQVAAGILEEAERRGAERVVVIEQAAQEAATAMREPIRAEVDELEGVRAQLLTDISALETHLESQRVRVRTAVEALRVGMSGSIEDLERVAEDDELLATQSAPPHSGATGADVAVADDVEIIDAVDAAVGEGPTVDEVEEAAVAQAEPITDDELELSTDDAAADVAVDETDAVPEVEIAAADESESTGPTTEPIPVIDPAPEATVEDIPVEEVQIDEGELLDEDELVDLGDEPSGIFGTEVGEDVHADDETTVVDLGAVGAGAAGVAAGAAGAAAAAAAMGDDESEPLAAPMAEPMVETVAEPVDDESEAEAVAEAPIDVASGSGQSFVDRFSEAIDDLPLTR